MTQQMQQQQSDTLTLLRTYEDISKTDTNSMKEILYELYPLIEEHRPDIILKNTEIFDLVIKHIENKETFQKIAQQRIANG